MRKRMSVLVLSATVVSDIGMFAKAPPEIGHIDGGWAIDAAQSTPPAPTTVSRSGTIDKYDASTRVLSLSTSNGLVQFTLAPVARIRRGRQAIEASELAKLSGYRAAVRYSEDGGKKNVESVHVFGKSERTGQ
jgi:hypothetical protein